MILPTRSFNALRMTLPLAVIFKALIRISYSNFSFFLL